ncbi:UNVERIFIED_CONTAM: uncharacterized protein ABIC26_003727 [Paenibacillus sp. PvR008]
MISSTYNSFYKLSNGDYVLINSLSGAIDTIGVEVKQFLDRIRKGDVPSRNEDYEPLYQFLEKRGYIYENRDSEWAKLLEIRDHVYRLQDTSVAGITFNVCTTYMCNLRCPYCYQGHEIHEKSHALTMTEIDKMFKAVDGILAMEKEKGRYQNATHRMMLYGGEPLLPTTRETVKEVVRRAVDEYGFRIYAITNGTFLHDYLDFFEQYKEEWDYFQISVDGPKSIHDRRRITAGGQGTFDRIVRNIDMALERGFRIALRTNINKDNVDHLEELVSFVEQKGWHEHPLFFWQISPVTDHYGDNLPNHLPEHKLLVALYEKFGDLEEFLEKYSVQLGTDLSMRTSRIRQAITSKDWVMNNPSDSCTSTPNTLPIFKECSAREHRFYAFGAEGAIYACPESVGRSEFAIGAFYPEFVINPIKHNMWDKDITDSEQCGTCSVSLFCGGGCAYSNLMRNGSITEPHCNYSHPTISTYVKRNEDIFLQVQHK